VDAPAPYGEFCRDAHGGVSARGEICGAGQQGQTLRHSSPSWLDRARKLQLLVGEKHESDHGRAVVATSMLGRGERSEAGRGNLDVVKVAKHGGPSERESAREQEVQGGMGESESWLQRAERLRVLSSGAPVESSPDATRPQDCSSSESEKKVHQHERQAAFSEGSKSDHSFTDVEAEARVERASGTREQERGDVEGRVLGADEVLAQWRAEYPGKRGAGYAARPVPRSKAAAAAGAAAARGGGSEAAGRWFRYETNETNGRRFRYVSPRRSPAFVQRYSPQRIFSGMHHKRRVSPKKLPAAARCGGSHSPYGTSFTVDREHPTRLSSLCASAGSPEETRKHTAAPTKVFASGLVEKFPGEVPLSSRLLTRQAAEAPRRAGDAAATDKTPRLAKLSRISAVRARVEQSARRLSGDGDLSDAACEMGLFGASRTGEALSAPWRSHSHRDLGGLSATWHARSSLPAATRGASVGKAVRKGQWKQTAERARRARSYSPNCRAWPAETPRKISTKGAMRFDQGGAGMQGSKGQGSSRGKDSRGLSAALRQRSPARVQERRGHSVFGHTRLVRLLTELGTGDFSGSKGAGSRRVALGLAVLDAVKEGRQIRGAASADLRDSDLRESLRPRPGRAHASRPRSAQASLPASHTKWLPPGAAQNVSSAVCSLDPAGQGSATSLLQPLSPSAPSTRNPRPETLNTCARACAD
jgi:hypothetical protein